MSPSLGFVAAFILGLASGVVLVLFAVAAAAYLLLKSQPAVDSHKPIFPQIWTEKSPESEGNIARRNRADSLESLEQDAKFHHKHGWLRISRTPHLTDAFGPNAASSVLGIPRLSTIVPGGWSAAESSADTPTGIDTAPPPNSYFCVLKYDTLFLYSTARQEECHAVIITSKYTVTPCPVDDRRENEVYLKDFPLWLSPRNLSEELTLGDYYIWPVSAYEKEEWHFALLSSGAAPHWEMDESSASHPGVQHPSPTRSPLSNEFQFDIQDWTAHLHRSIPQPSAGEHDSGPLADDGLAWLNVLIGRLFFSVHRTQRLHDQIITRITRKVSRLPIPSFIQDIRVRDLSIGRGVPCVTRPQLLEAREDGTVCIELDLDYVDAGARIEIEVRAEIPVPGRAQPVAITAIIAVAVHAFRGRAQLLVKPPPSNRLWIGFAEPPIVDVTVEPILEERRVGFGLIKRFIDSKIRELMREGIVLPNMDDSPFWDADGAGGMFVTPSNPFFAGLGGNTPSVVAEPELTVQIDSTGNQLLPNAESSACLGSVPNDDRRSMLNSQAASSSLLTRQLSIEVTTPASTLGVDQAVKQGLQKEIGQTLMSRSVSADASSNSALTPASPPTVSPLSTSMHRPSFRSLLDPAKAQAITSMSDPILAQGTAFATGTAMRMQHTGARRRRVVNSLMEIAGSMSHEGSYSDFPDDWRADESCEVYDERADDYGEYPGEETY